jgi:hypothetical protein
MPRYYYGAVPALAWILNHYFYSGLHYNWLAAEFFPLETNPKSSIPYLVYGDLYWAWSRDDRYDKHLRMVRDSLRLGVTARLPPGISDLTLVRRLRRICRRAAVTLVLSHRLSGRQRTHSSGKAVRGRLGGHRVQ